jgi:hypothetical protein
MARKHVLYAVAAAGFISAFAMGLLTVLPFASSDSQSPPRMSTQAVLQVSTMLNRLRLFSGDVDPVTSQRASLVDRSNDLTGQSGLARHRYVKNFDGSTEDVSLKADGEHIDLRQVYYAWQPGSTGWHRSLVQQHSPTSDLIVDEQKFRYDGTMEEHTTASEDGARHVVGYGADGIKVIHEVVIAAKETEYGTPVLQKEMRWRDDADTTLSYSNIYDSVSKKRRITDWDQNHNPLMVVEPGSEGGHEGTITTAYFPGTSLVRMHSVVQSDVNMVQYFRKDGTVHHILQLGPGSVLVQLFDSTGKTKVLQQMWFRETSIVNHKAETKFSLDMVVEMDPQGNDARAFHVWGDRIEVEEKNQVYEGVSYGEVDHTYAKGPTGWTLEDVKCWLGKADHGYDKDEVHKPEEHILMPALPDDELKAVVNLNEDPDLLLPDPRYYPGGQ